MISALLNILWVVLGGFVMALGWWLAGLLCAITIIGLPWARSCFVVRIVCVILLKYLRYPCLCAFVVLLSGSRTCTALLFQAL